MRENKSLVTVPIEFVLKRHNQNLFKAVFGRRIVPGTRPHERMFLFCFRVAICLILLNAISQEHFEGMY